MYSTIIETNNIKIDLTAREDIIIRTNIEEEENN